MAAGGNSDNRVDDRVGERLAEELRALRETVAVLRRDLDLAESDRIALANRVAALAAELTDARLAEAERRETPLLPILPPRSAPPPPEPGPTPALIPPEPREDAPRVAEPLVTGSVDGGALLDTMSDAELEARAAFVREYAGSASAAPRAVADPNALPAAADRRRILVAEHPSPRIRPAVDVVVCVHDALPDLRTCLWSLLEKTGYPFRLVLVNDGSDAATTDYLRDLAQREPAVHLVERLSPPHGYTRAANAGLRAATGDYVVLLNSDTIVTPGWLERIVDCGESDPAIGVLGPLSNAASHQSVPNLREQGRWATNPLPAFASPDGVALLLERVAARERPRFPFINGFCYVIKRSVLEAIGYLDEERFGSGYCEENDFSVRAADAGFALAVVDDAYVFHAKSRSFTVEGRNVIAKRNYEIFLDKHGRDRVQARVDALESDDALGPLRSAVADALSADAAFTAALGLPSLRVAYVLPGLSVGGSGGSHSVYQEVRSLRRLGVQAEIALQEEAMARARDAYEDADELFRPFRDVDELAAVTEGADVISATHFKSVALVAELRRRRSNFLPAYYVQDYEPFFIARDSADLTEALASYTAIDDCLLFAKTHWLCNVVASRHGVYVAKVEPSIDEQVYRPSGSASASGVVSIAAMVRPRTPRRQPTATVGVLEEILAAHPGVEVSTFGCSRGELERFTREPLLLANHREVLSRRDVAGLLASSDVFLDMSMYQAFGRTALEAMACGATVVAPRLGGAWEFLEHGQNGLAVDTLAPEEAVAALTGLIEDPDTLRSLQAAARRTGASYSVLRAAVSEYAVFAREHARRFGADRSR